MANLDLGEKFETPVSNMFAEKDPSLDIESLLSEAYQTKKESKSEDAVPEAKQMVSDEPMMNALEEKSEETDATIHQVKPASLLAEAKPSEAPISPLAELKQARENQETGMILSNQELDEGKEKTEKGDIFMNDRRLKDFEDYETELDDKLKKRKYIKVIRKPMNPYDYAQIMLEIDSVRIGTDGQPYYDLKDPYGNPAIPKYTEITPLDPIKNTKNDEGLESKEESTNDSSSSASGEETEEDANEPRKLTPEESKIVQVIIDKTGLGTDVIFTDDEKEKIRSSELIDVKEVRHVDIKAIKDKVSKRSFQDVASKFDYSDSRMSIFFPASGFKAQMKGLTYGEFADIALSMENMDEEKFRKRLSIIYNKMTNVSIGEFASFDDFLKHFCYIDINLAIYALYVATESDKQEIQLRCGNPKCGKNFDWTYNTRSIIRLERCSKKFLEKMEELITADASKYDKIHEESVVLNSHYIELPKSKFIIEIGLASAYDYLHNVVPILNEDRFKEIFGEDFNEMHLNISVLLTTVRSIRVPDVDGNYIVCDTYRSIIDAIYRISPEEIAILNTYSMKFQEAYEMSFGFDKVECPHCGTKTRFIPVTPDNLVFTTYQRLANTEINLEMLQDF